MLRHIARALGLLGRQREIPVTPDVIDEVSEYGGVLLVRLGHGSAMQVRAQTDTNVWFRIVPIAKATQLESDSPWQAASDSQVAGWIHPGSAIGQWLLAKGNVAAKNINSCAAA